MIARMPLAAVVLLVVASSAHAQAPIVARGTSSVLGEVREFTVRLPASYARERQRRYPVVYVLDGAPLDGHTATGGAQVAALGNAPELIVVGIPNIARRRAGPRLPAAVSGVSPPRRHSRTARPSGATKTS